MPVTRAPTCNSRKCSTSRSPSTWPLITASWTLTVPTTTPFPDDRQHASYDRDAVEASRDRFAFLLPNGTQIVICYLACATSGIVGTVSALTPIGNAKVAAARRDRCTTTWRAGVNQVALRWA